MKPIDTIFFIIGLYVTTYAAGQMWGTAAGWFTGGCCLMVFVALDTRRPTAGVASGS